MQTATFIDYNGRTDEPFTLEFSGTPSLKYDGLWDNGRTPTQVAIWNDEDSCWFVYANSGNYSDIIFGTEA